MSRAVEHMAHIGSLRAEREHMTHVQAREKIALTLRRSSCRKGRARPAKVDALLLAGDAISASNLFISDWPAKTRKSTRYPAEPVSAPGISLDVVSSAAGPVIAPAVREAVVAGKATLAHHVLEMETWKQGANMVLDKKRQSPSPPQQRPPSPWMSDTSTPRAPRRASPRCAPSSRR